MLTLRLFGRFNARISGEPLPNLHRREGERLLAYLALHSGESVAYRTLAKLFFPADVQYPGGTLPNTRQGITGLRKSLGAEAYRLMNPRRGFLTLNLAGADSDVAAFDQLAASDDPAHWREALELSTAPLLEGGTESWVRTARLRRESERLRLLRGLWERAFVAGETTEEERLRPLLLEADPKVVLSVEAPNNLPVPMTTFIGREAEMERIMALADRARLVTLTGPGGCGKTRIALEAASRLLPRFPGGVFLVELAAVSDERRVPQIVAGAMGLRDVGGGDVTAALARFIAGRRLLLLLDNDEHLIHACAALADALLRACPHLTILAASREPLKIEGEQNFRLPPLSLPDGDAGRLNVAASEAVRLFVDRAALADANFALTDDNAATISEICRRLDGIPLALELAAARLRSLTLEELSGQLRQSFAPLSDGNRLAPLRQQTLDALIDWSYNLLKEDERGVFRRLSVFVGGWTSEVAARVCGVENGRFLAMHTALTDKSLLTRTGDGRYGFMEMVRQFTAERLARDDAEMTETLIRHTQTFVDMARRVGDASDGKTAGLDSPDELRFLRQIDAEYENIQAAMGRASGEDALWLASSLEPYWRIRDQSAEAGRRLTAALDRPDAQTPSIARVRALVALAGFSAIPGGEKRAQEALTIARSLGDVQGEAVTLARLAGYHDAPLTRDELAAAVALKRQSSTLATTVGDYALLTWNHLALTWLYRESGDSATALTCASDALTVARQTRNPRALTLSLIACAECRLDAAENRQGVTIILTEASTLARAIGNRRYFARLAIAQARLAWQEGETETGFRVLDNALRESETQYGDPTSLRKTKSELQQWRGYFSARNGDPVAAREALRLAATLQQPSTLPLKRFYVYLRLVAALASAERDFHHVPHFEGVAEALRARIPMANPPSLIQERTADLDAARAALGDARFDALWETGRRLTEAEARIEMENFLLPSI